MNDKNIVGTKKKISTGLLVLVLISILALVSILIINAYVTSSIKDKIITVDKAASLDVDCILILGAGVWGERPRDVYKRQLLKRLT